MVAPLVAVNAGHSVSGRGRGLPPAQSRPMPQPILDESARSVLTSRSGECKHPHYRTPSDFAAVETCRVCHPVPVSAMRKCSDKLAPSLWAALRSACNNAFCRMPAVEIAAHSPKAVSLGYSRRYAAITSAALPAYRSVTRFVNSSSLNLSSRGLSTPFTISFRHVPMSNGTWAEIAGAAGSNGCAGRILPSTTGPPTHAERTDPPGPATPPQSRSLRSNQSGCGTVWIFSNCVLPRFSSSSTAATSLDEFSTERTAVWRRSAQRPCGTSPACRGHRHQRGDFAAAA